jgi:putative membrane protein
VLAVLGYILPGLALGDAELAGRDGEGGFTSAPRRARWVDPLGWRRRGFLVSDPALLLRRGRLHRYIDVVPHARTQSCGVWQGPLQRRLGLATFELHSTPGPVKPVVEHLSSTVAAELLDQQSERARTARATAHDEWLTPAPADTASDSV